MCGVSRRRREIGSSVHNAEMSACVRGWFKAGAAEVTKKGQTPEWEIIALPASAVVVALSCRKVDQTFCEA